MRWTGEVRIPLIRSLKIGCSRAEWSGTNSILSITIMFLPLRFGWNGEFALFHPKNTQIIEWNLHSAPFHPAPFHSTLFISWYPNVAYDISYLYDKYLFNSAKLAYLSLPKPNLNFLIIFILCLRVWRRKGGRNFEKREGLSEKNRMI